MINLTRKSKYIFVADDVTIEIKNTGDAPNLRNFSGSWKFSSSHGDMLPHKPLFSVYKNQQLLFSDLHEEDIYQRLLAEGFKLPVRFI